MRLLRLLAAFVCTATMSLAAAYTWTGAAGDHAYGNPANWAGNAVPPNDGTAVLVFGAAADKSVTLPLYLDVAQVRFSSPAQNYTFGSALLSFLVVENGLVCNAGNQRIGNGVTLSLAGSQNISVTSGTLELAGGLIGTGSLVKTGSGELRVTGVNLLAGGTQVSSGSVVFANTYALPAGSITASAGGYVGAEDATTLKYLLGQLESGTFTGAIGLDSAPGAATSVYSDQIDVTGLAGYAGIGSSTSALLTGNFKVAAGQDYRFGGGAGTLTVRSNLTNSTSGLQVHSVSGQPLTVVLQGSNNFGGATSILNSVLILDSQQAVFGGKILNIDGPGYVGSTEHFTTSNSSFLSLLHSTSPNAIAGFDSADPATPRTISTPVDLSVGGTRTDPYYLGTATRITITGAITPTTGDALYLTAVKGGYLTVGSTLGSDLPGLVVGQSNSFDPQGGTVELTGRNSYTGGTRVLGGTLRMSNSSALGTGAVAVGSGATLDVSSGTNLANPLSLSSGARLAGSGTLSSVGGVSFGSGTLLSPGGAGRVGTLTFATPLTLGSGSSFEFDVQNLKASPGTGWDLVFAYNQVNLASTASNPILINLNSLTLGGAPGLVSGFDASQSYTWLFLVSDVRNFSQDLFAFNTANFANSLDGGTFKVAQGTAGLNITFTPVPEPATYLLFASGLALVAALELRRRKK